uniref:Uncharacterized protein n=1 Tax=Ditylum brightwellii TaxID=49249 RepID=A0A7S4R8W9_9STRA
MTMLLVSFILIISCHEFITIKSIGYMVGATSSSSSSLTISPLSPPFRTFGCVTMIPRGGGDKNNESEDEGDGEEEVVVAHEKDESENDETTTTTVVNELDSTDAAAAAVDETNTKEEGEDKADDSPTNDNNDKTAKENDDENTIWTKRSEASNLRILGKQHHDSGELSEAASTFREAATVLQCAMERHLDTSKTTDSEQRELVEEYATCRLHEALCHLKAGEFTSCVESCTDVLEDGVQVAVVEDESESEEEEESDDDDENETKKLKTKIQIIQNAPSSTTAISAITSPAVRARAYHRRAKARLELNDTIGALDDARSAAFLGDRNAVALYGRLMREKQQGTTNGFGDSSSLLNSLTSSSSSSPTVSSLLSGFMDQNGNDNGGGGGVDPTAAILGSLLNSGSSSSSGDSPLGALGQLASAFGAAAPSNSANNLLGENSELNKKRTKSSSKRRRRKSKRNKNKKPDTLAKSILTKLSKRIEDKSTQELICRYLQNTNKQQIMSYSTMAGLTISEPTAEKIASVATTITPAKIDKGVKRTKRILLVVSVLRKVLKVIQQYKHLIVLWFLLGWIRSACVRPYPVNKKKVIKAAAAAATGGDAVQAAANFFIF